MKYQLLRIFQTCKLFFYILTKRPLCVTKRASLLTKRKTFAKTKIKVGKMDKNE